MTEKQILFKADMVRAILDGRKTQTRRVVKPQPLNIVPFVGTNDNPTGEFGVCNHHHGVIDKHVACPYGQPGDQLWVRETFCTPGNYLAGYRADGVCGCFGYHPNGTWTFYRHGSLLKDVKGFATATPSQGYGDKWTPSIHMPRWASRIQLEITDIRVERLQDISGRDAVAEGMRCRLPDNGVAQSEFAELWESTYGSDSWDANPWVWVIHFRRCMKSMTENQSRENL